MGDMMQVEVDLDSLDSTQVAETDGEEMGKG